MQELPQKRLVNGFLLVNKPSGVSSNFVLQKVKRLYNAIKAGHCGNLDPLATGMLPICFGEATKFSQNLLDDDKCYEVTAQLGIKTTTGDATGDIVEHKAHNFNLTDLERVLLSFHGKITQTPSIYSALKYNGKPYYYYARNNIDIPRKSRVIEIYDLQLLSYQEHHFTLRVLCSKGTYIRNLVEDIAIQLNTLAHVTALHRLYSANFASFQMHLLENLTTLPLDELDKKLLACDILFKSTQRLKLSSQDAIYLRQGRILKLSETLCPGLVTIYNTNEEFIGLGQYENNILKAHRLLSC